MATQKEEVEGHMKWIADLEAKIQVSAKKREESIKDISRKILGMMTEDVGLSNDWQRDVPLIAKKLTCAAIFISSGDVESAKSLLSQLDNPALEAMTNVHDSQLKVVRYSRDVLWWNIKSFQNGNQEETADELGLDWKELLGDRKCTAMISFLKGFLALELYVDEWKTLEFFEEAVRLEASDRDCSGMYFSYAYSRLAWIRRNVVRRVDGQYEEHGGRLLENSVEGNWAQAAFSRLPQNPVVIVNYARMLHETIQWRSLSYLEAFEKRKCEKVMSLFRQALDAAEMDGNDKLIEKIKVHFAEYLVDAEDSGPCADWNLGCRLFLECADSADDQSSSVVFFRVAKFLYHQRNQINREGILTEAEALQRSESIFERCLKMKPVSYRAVVEYLKVLKILGHGDPDVTKMLSVVSKALEGPLRDCIAAKLRTVRGCLIWAYTPERKNEAVDDWMFVLKNLDPRHSHNVYDAILLPIRKIIPDGKGGKICWIAEVISYLQTEKGRWDGDDDLEIMERFIQELAHRRKSRKPVYKSVADKDNNWRR